MMRIYIAVALLYFGCLSAQNQRINTRHSIGWYNLFTTISLDDKFSIHGEYQWRRDEIIENWQQGLLRVGLNYRLNPRVLFRVGYVWVETYNYGEIPLNAFGFSFTEHRFFQMAQLQHNEGRFQFSHRFKLEQRFIGRFNDAFDDREDKFPLLHRARYMFRLQFPLKGESMADHTPYVAVYDEIFIGFGENVAANIFDQNRIGVMLGYRFNSKLRIEGGYFNQILQYARTVDNKNVFQYNNGIILNTFLNF